MGSTLFNRDINQWKSTLLRLKKFPECAIFEALKISYDRLHETEKKIFLYIACFFNHEYKNSVVSKLDYLDLYPAIGLVVLVEKSLIKINDDIVFEMELVRQVEVNIDYILMLVEKYHKSNCEDKEVLAAIDRAIKSSLQLRSKKELIENFIASINVKHCF